MCASRASSNAPIYTRREQLRSSRLTHARCLVGVPSQRESERSTTLTTSLQGAPLPQPTQSAPAVGANHVAATAQRKTLNRRASRLSALDSTTVVRRLVRDLLVDEHRTVTCTSNSDSIRAAPVGIPSRRHRRALLQRRGRDVVRIHKSSSSVPIRRCRCVNAVWVRRESRLLSLPHTRLTLVASVGGVAPPSSAATFIVLA